MQAEKLDLPKNSPALDAKRRKAVRFVIFFPLLCALHSWLILLMSAAPRWMAYSSLACVPITFAAYIRLLMIARRKARRLQYAISIMVCFIGYGWTILMGTQGDYLNRISLGGDLTARPYFLTAGYIGCAVVSSIFILITFFFSTPGVLFKPTNRFKTRLLTLTITFALIVIIGLVLDAVGNSLFPGMKDLREHFVLDGVAGFFIGMGVGMSIVYGFGQKYGKELQQIDANNAAR